jgi:hypothetical protein
MLGLSRGCVFEAKAIRLELRVTKQGQQIRVKGRGLELSKARG